MFATVIEGLISWIASRLFGGDKTAEYAEEKGKLEAQNEAQKNIIKAIFVKKQSDEAVDVLSDADVATELRNDWQRD